MTSWLPSEKYDVVLEIWLSQSMPIYSRNIPDKFHPDLIWNDGALDFFWSGRPNKKKKNKNKRSSDIGSVPDR